tara:strand:+ start:370 stop:633 length:264 start_codon:yes stop_codon:yes gene_type:complete
MPKSVNKPSPIILKLISIIFLILSVSIPLGISLIGLDYIKSIEDNEVCKQIKENRRFYLFVYFCILLALSSIYLTMGIPTVLFTRLR